MRIRDLHILTAGTVAFSSDTRFHPQHTPGSDAWTLRLDNVKKTDSGIYECQINTEPKIMYAVRLSVRGVFSYFVVIDSFFFDFVVSFLVL